MLENIFVTVLTSSGIIGVFTQFLLSRMKASEQKQNALELGVQALLRDRLIYQYEKYKSQGYARFMQKRILKISMNSIINWVQMVSWIRFMKSLRICLFQ